MRDNGNTPYLSSIHSSLPRVLSLIDRDPFSPSFGFADRFHWAWKLIDFPNGSFQGLAHGLSLLSKLPDLPEKFKFDAPVLLDRIIQGTGKILRPNGSTEEAFPYESSYCVTALVAYDLLSAIEALSSQLSPTLRKQYLHTISPMIHFLEKNDEHHAFISNHLATAAAALIKWSHLNGQEPNKKGQELLQRILKNQSSEGWYLEYQGADPGYQTLCVHYLIGIHQITRDPVLLESLLNSVKFLAYFVHPDGSFGGYYGSRNTRFYYPSGIRYLSQFSPLAAAIDRKMAQAVVDHNVVGLSCMDEANLTPMFNSYAQACTFENPVKDLPLLPFEDSNFKKLVFPKAGIEIRSSENFYSVVNFNKGGVVYHYNRLLQQANWDCGTVFLKKDTKQYYSTQVWGTDPLLESGPTTLAVQAQLRPLLHRLPQPHEFIVLRVLNLTIMRSVFLGNLIKKFLVKLLITGGSEKSLNVKRKITWLEDGRVEVTTSTDGLSTTLWQVQPEKEFRSIHMASSGYWQKGDL